MSVETSLLRFVTLGSVDDGKSTLLGRLLYDSGNLPDDQKAALDASKEGSLNILPDFSLITDGLLAEQEQKITIDVAYRYFRSGKRVFILADSPGHEQYTRNMATAASTADVALLLVDARNGITTQTRRHAFIASLLGIKRVVLLVNKMDLVSFSEDRFSEIVEELTAFSRKLEFIDIHSIPVSALEGDNVVHRSEKMKWYGGEPLLSYLEGLYIGGSSNPIDFRYPVQYVIRPNQNYRGFAGQILSGRIHVGDKVTILPSRSATTVKAIDVYKNGKVEELQEATAPQSVTLRLSDEVDASRGDMIVRTMNVPRIDREVEAMMVWFSKENLDPSATYLVLHCGRYIKTRISDIRYKVDVNNFSREDASTFELNNIGRVHLLCHEPLYYDSYNRNRGTGSFIVIDPNSHQTVAAGMIIERDVGSTVSLKQEKEPRSQNLHDERSELVRSVREERSGHGAFTLWFTGLSGSGKSTICRNLEHSLFSQEKRVYWLDGDRVRRGLCRDLGFAREERAENLRRVAEVAKLFNDAGVIVLCSFITPFQSDQEIVKNIIGEKNFRLIYLNSSLEVCEKRDPHGLYKKARAGEISGFTGIGSPYEAPPNPDLDLNTGTNSVEKSLETLEDFISELLETK